MPNLTPNLGLIKPLDTETADIAVINQNMDKIDEEIARTSTVETDLTAHLAETMPHKFTDGSKTYRWGLSVVNDVLMFNYEEVV